MSGGSTKEYYAEYRKRNRKKRNDYAREYGTGWTAEQYKQALKRQKGRCVICASKPDQKVRAKELHADHCHKSGIRRGLLCQRCNHGLGLFKDNVDLLQRAIDYLEAYQ